MTYLQKIEALLDMPAGDKSEVLRELESHLTDIKEELVASGMSTSQAQSEAEVRLGSPEDVALRLTAAHNTASWRSTILTIVSFLASSVVLLLSLSKLTILTVGLTALIGVIAAVASAREIARHRRSLWFATWFATALLCAESLICRITASFSGPETLIVMKTMTISGLGLGILTLAAAFGVRRGKLAAIILYAVYFVSAIITLENGPTEEQGNIFLFIIIWLFRPIMLVMLARSIFEFHPYGNAARASLFILAVLALEYPSSQTPLQTSYAAVAALLTGALVIGVVRASTSTLKEAALVLSILPLALANMLSTQHYYWFEPRFPLIANIIYFVFALALSYFGPLYTLIMFPFWDSVQRRSANPPVTTQ